MARASRRFRTVAALATAAALTVPAVAAAPAVYAATASITIADPGTPPAGDVTLRGKVALDTSPQTTSVLYAVDVSGSTNDPSGLDCDGANGAGDPGDNINEDPVVGDLLDCELAAVRALDADLAAQAGDVQVGLEAFAGTAATADLSPAAGEVTFIPPGLTDAGDSSSRMKFVTKNVVRNLIKKYTSKPLDSARTSFDAAVDTAVQAFQGAPAGPRIMFFMSDVVKEGTGPGTMAKPVSADRLAALQNAGIKVRTFAVGGSAGCDTGTSLARMAAATGEICVPVKNPASLQANVLGSQSQAIRSVTVAVNGTVVNAKVDSVNGWSATLKLGQGSYNVTATATLSDGSKVSAARTVTVGPAAAGTTPPPPGTVTPTGSTMLASKIGARRSKPIKRELPKRIKGKVAAATASLGGTPALNGATVLLQGRSSSTAPWATVGRATVSGGNYLVSWKRKKTVHQLQVVLQPFNGYDVSSTTVPTPKISNCSVTKVKRGKKLVCHTTLPRRTKAALLQKGKVLDTAKVRKSGTVKVVSPGKLRGKVLKLYPTVGKKIRLKY